MARVLVIGGTLFIGRALVERLLQRGDDVTILHRQQGTPFGERVTEIHCDRNDLPALRTALAGSAFDLVFDNVYDWQRGTTAEHVRATAMATRGARRYVFMSSVSVYGQGEDHDEQDTLVPPDAPDDYARNKAESERALFELHQTDGIPVTTLRPAFIYGPHNAIDREAFFWDRIVADRPVIIPGDGQRAMQFVLVGDVAGTAIRAAGTEVAAGGTYNLGNEPSITQIQFVQALARAAGREPRLVFVARDRIAAAGGDVFRPPLYFGTYLDLLPLTVRCDRLRAELGIELTPFDEGLRETFAWYRRQTRTRPDFSWEDRLIDSLAG
jgi:nucleoside-diphosphate-sugar epimerase